MERQTSEVGQIANLEKRAVLCYMAGDDRDGDIFPCKTEGDRDTLLQEGWHEISEEEYTVRWTEHMQWLEKQIAWADETIAELKEAQIANGEAIK